MIVGIIITISLLLDGILTNYLPFLQNDLSYFTPLLTVSSIFILSPFYRKKTNHYLLHMFLLGILYDLFFTNLLFWNAILFVEIAYLSKIIYQNIEISFLKLIFIIPLIIILYESSNALIIFIFQLVPITFMKVFYKIIHSLLLNIIYIEIIYLLLKRIPKKYKKISLN